MGDNGRSGHLRGVEAAKGGIVSNKWRTVSKNRCIYKPCCADDNVHFLFRACTVNKSFGCNAFHVFTKDSRIILDQRLEEATTRL